MFVLANLQPADVGVGVGDRDLDLAVADLPYRQIRRRAIPLKSRSIRL